VCVCVCVCVSPDVPDSEVEVEGVPVAPLDVRCHDANKDYVVVTWKQPAVEGSSSILGYYIDRLETVCQRHYETDSWDYFGHETRLHADTV